MWACSLRQVGTTSVNSTLNQINNTSCVKRTSARGTSRIPWLHFPLRVWGSRIEYIILYYMKNPPGVSPGQSKVPSFEAWSKNIALDKKIKNALPTVMDLYPSNLCRPGSFYLIFFPPNLSKQRLQNVWNCETTLTIVSKDWGQVPFGV